MRVLIVDDSAFMRRMIERMVATDPTLEVVGIARNGRDGLDQIAKLKPDVVTMDIEMPELDGLAALRELRRTPRAERPAVLMCSSLTTAGSDAAMKALRLGASDVIAKDAQVIGRDSAGFAAELLSKIKAIGEATRERHTDPAAHPERRPSDRPCVPIPSGPIAFRPGQFDLIAIGSSTGGPPALEDVLTRLPADLTAPVVIAQHMPAMFTRSLATRLDGLCKLKVQLGTDGAVLSAGQVYVLEGGLHGRIRRKRSGVLELEVGAEPLSALYKPSVNELMRSAGECCGHRVLGVMLTGMGDDGLIGTKTLRERGGAMLAQDQASCVVWGMPRAVTNAGLIDAALPPVAIAACLARLGAGAVGEEGLRRSA